MTLKIIGGKFKGRVLKVPSGPSTRPSQGMLRESLFNIVQGEIEGARFLDLFAGSGAIGLEALSRGAGGATLVEQNPRAIACIKENIDALHLGTQARLIPLNSKKALFLLTKEGTQFDLIFIDPPYDLSIEDFSGQLFSLLSPGGAVFLEQRFSEKTKNHPPEIAGLQLKNSRRFGIALLHQYRST
jgi:16S rRNA (guanine966-N2)-methyltransferase